MAILDAIKIGVGAVLGIILMLGNNALFHDRAVRKDALQGYVALSEKTALEAKLAEKDRQIKAGNLVVSSYQEQLRNARAAEAARAEEVEQEIADYETRINDAGRRCDLDADDIDWLRKP